VPDPFALEQGAARLEGVASRLAAALDAATIGPTDWAGTAAERFQDDLDAQRRTLAGVVHALRRQAALARVAAAQLRPAS
jgi:hypothetical protein